MEGDLKEILDYTSDPEVMRYLPENTFTKEDAKEFINKNIYKKPEEFAVILKDENKLVCHIIFHIWYEPFKTWEIGWVFNREYHRKGFA